ncbi:hypothetical protein [Bradyrhizobium sp. USDA 4350]
MKTCTKCFQAKDERDFYFASTGKRASVCMECVKAAANARYHARKPTANWRKRYPSKPAALEAIRAAIPAGTTVVMIDTFSGRAAR